MVDMDTSQLAHAEDSATLVEAHVDLVSSCQDTPIIVVTTLEYTLDPVIKNALLGKQTRTNNKMRQNAFEHPSLTPLLHSYGAQHLLVTGLFLGQCVDATITGAYLEGFTAFTTRDLSRFQKEYDHLWSPASQRDYFNYSLEDIKKKIK